MVPQLFHARCLSFTGLRSTVALDALQAAAEISTPVLADDYSRVTLIVYDASLATVGAFVCTKDSAPVPVPLDLVRA